jgi:hypothetical protein
MPALSGAELARANYVASRAWAEFTQERAKRLVEREDADDTEAREAWRAVSSLVKSEQPAAVQMTLAQDLQLLHLMRVLRECCKFSPVFVTQFTTVMMQMLTRLVAFHLECEEVINRSLRNESSGYADNDPHLNGEQQRVANATLVIVLPLLCSRSTFLGVHKAQYLTQVGRLVAQSSDAGVLRTCFRLMSSWFEPSPTPKATISYGLSQGERTRLLEQALLFLAIQPTGLAQVHRDISLRVQKLPADLFLSLQTDFYNLMLRLYTGSDEVGLDARGALTFMRHMFKLLNPARAGEAFSDPEPLSPHLANPWTRPTHYWFTTLHRYVGPGLACGDSSVRQRCFNLVMAHARVRRVYDMRDEVRRAALSRELAHEGFDARGKRRRADNGPVAPLLSYAVPDRFASGALLPIIASSSRRVSGLPRKAPNMRLVTMATPGLWMPRVVMHWCWASMITATPRGCSTSLIVLAICAVIFSWICRRLA